MISLKLLALSRKRHRQLKQQLKQLLHKDSRRKRLMPLLLVLLGRKLSRLRIRELT